MLLAIDIGNTNITLGLHHRDGWISQWRLRTDRDKTVDEYGIYLRSLLQEFLTSRPLESVVMSSVVPPLTSTIEQVCDRYFDCIAFTINHLTDTGISIATDNPSEVGADRIVNAAAAQHLYPCAAIVVDMGTATTFDAISSRRELLGVAIAPGLGLAAEALSGRAAQLGQVALEAPPAAIGRNTTHAMQSGLVFGYVSLIDGMVRRIRDEMKEPVVRVIGTGGLINVISKHTKIFDAIELWLTLTGLLVIYRLNHS